VRAANREATTARLGHVHAMHTAALASAHRTRARPDREVRGSRASQLDSQLDRYSPYLVLRERY